MRTGIRLHKPSRMLSALIACQTILFANAWGKCVCLKNQLKGRTQLGTVCALTELEKREQNRGLLEHHIIAIDQDGYGLEPVSLEAIKNPQSYKRMLEPLLDSAIQGVRSGRYNRIIFFIHGGLNTFSSSIGRAISLTAKMGTDKVNKAYPIFIIWKSGPFSTYGEHVFKIRQGQVNPYRIPRVVQAPFIFATDVMTGVAHSPVLILENVWTDIKTMDPRFDLNSDAIYKAIRDSSRNATPMDVHKGEDSIGAWHKAGRSANYFLTLPLRWVSDPVIDAFGTPDWNIMLRRTNTLFRTNDEFDVRNIREKDSVLNAHLNSTPTGALSLALSLFREKINGDTAVRMDLIGHSMGAIVANQILLNFPDLRFDNLVYMAAACRVRDFNEYVVPYLKNHCGKDSNHTAKTHFYTLTLHPLAERRETNVTVLGFDFFQRGSLLEWIDNFFSSPNNTEERTLGKYENIFQCIHMIPEEYRAQVTIKTFGAGRFSPSVPQKHGSFTDYPFWRKEFWSTKAPTDTTVVQAIPDSSGYHL